MPIDITTPQSPGWWLDRLQTRLMHNRGRYDRLDSYYRGEAPLPWGPDNCQDAYRAFQKKARANWASLIVEAARERMHPVGFRTGADSDEGGDELAWRIWQANHLDADAALVHRAKMSMGDAYTIVGGIDEDRGVPRITGEDPRQVVHEADPRDRRRSIAAMKVTDHDAILYLPGLIYRAERTNSDSLGRWSPADWEWRNLDNPDRLPARIVPVIHHPNRADLTGRSLGEFEDVVDDIDRINLMLLQRLTVAVFQAFRQRAVSGDLPDVDENGEPIDYDEVFKAGPAAVWNLPKDVTLWESAGVDLTPILESVKADVRDLAAITRTPMFYLFPDAANGSAEGASLQREGLIFKVVDRIREASEPWEETMSLAFLLAGDLERASRSDMEVIWTPPERFSLAERSDAAVKAAAAGVPWRTIMTDFMQFSPQQVDRMESQRFADSFTAAVAEAP